MHTALGMASRKRALEARGTKECTVPGEGRAGWQGSLGKGEGKSSWGAWKHREGVFRWSRPSLPEHGSLSLLMVGRKCLHSVIKDKKQSTLFLNFVPWKDVADSLTWSLRTKVFAELALFVSKELLTEWIWSRLFPASELMKSLTSPIQFLLTSG